MAKQKKKKATVSRKPSTAAVSRQRHTHKDTAIDDFIREHKSTVGLKLTATDRAVVASMTAEQIEKMTGILRLAWGKGVRYGSYTESQRRGK